MSNMLKPIVVTAAVVVAVFTAAAAPPVFSVSPRRASVAAAAPAVLPVRITLTAPGSSPVRNAALDVAVVGTDGGATRSQLGNSDHLVAVFGGSAVDAATALLGLLRVPEQSDRVKLLLVFPGGRGMNDDEISRLAAAAARGGVRMAVIDEGGGALSQLEAELTAARLPTVRMARVRVVTPAGVDRNFSGSAPVVWQDKFELLMLCPVLGAGERLEARLELTLPPVSAGQTREIGIIELEYQDAVSGEIRQEKIPLTAEFLTTVDIGRNGNERQTVEKRSMISDEK